MGFLIMVVVVVIAVVAFRPPLQHVGVTTCQGDGFSYYPCMVL
ncbi:MAG: hypothetical protein C0P72_006960 [Clostridia bacterium]